MATVHAATAPESQRGGGFVPRESDWRILQALCGYRLLLALLLMTLFYSGITPGTLGGDAPRLFRLAVFGYLGAGVLTTLVLRWRASGLILQSTLQFAADLGCLTLIVLSSGGIDSGLGVLLIAPAVGYAMVLPSRLALLTAAASTLAMFCEEIYRQLGQGWNASDFTSVGMLGVIFFATALAANQMALRARKSEAQAARVGSELLNLSRINDSIVESMRTAVIVVDNEGRMRAFNAAARRLLRLGDGEPGDPLLAREPALVEAVELWRQGLPGAYSPIVIGNVELLPRYTRLAAGGRAPLLIVLEDAAQVRAEAQRMKLAALGRLSASIAHEIRNPLSAIQQASQLLEESAALAGEDRRLLEMVHRHAARIDRIVRDVLDLSRPQARPGGTLDLRAWLQQCRAHYFEAHGGQSRPIELPPPGPDSHVRFHGEHLRQVLFNLWDNAFEHGGQQVRLELGENESGQPWLDVRDDGPGIPEEQREQIFEPFYTTDHAGTGLGLYLARELCEYNLARLACRSMPGRGACFRILFARAGGAQA